MLKLCFTGDICNLKDGINELANDFNYAASFCSCCDADDCIKVSVTQEDGEKLSVKYSKGEAEIVYAKKYHFFRSLGLLVEHLQSSADDFSTEETAYFTMNGPMFDVSHANAVINVKATKSIIRRMAIMGLNMLMMYCEDNYDVPGHPYFGYMRPRYSEADMRTLDEYADMFGIEMIPCMQTLAHLHFPLRWSVYSDIKEDNDCLLVGEEKTYDFIRDLLVAASRPFKTKRIHIGMDEAWKLGRGRYQDLHGIVPKTEIMLRHLNRVMEIVRELGLQPMIWSDMFFRAASDANEYYDPSIIFSDEVKNAVPKDVQLVYWDYYHNDVEDFYNDYIDKHLEIGDTIFAGGIHTWGGFGANFTKTLRTTNPALMACKKKGIKEIFATTWGDGGTESSIYATLPGLSLFAEHGYSYELDEEKFRKRMEFCLGSSYDDFANISGIEETPGAVEKNLDYANPSKALMWQDILCGLIDKNIEGLPLNAHYEALAEKLKPACDRNGEYNGFFKFNYHIAYTLALKSEMGLRLTAAYKSGNKAELKKYAAEHLPELRRRVVDLRKSHMDHWYDINKALGWDIMDMRYGSLITRIDTAIDVINMYLDGTLPTIEELDEPRLLYNNQPDLTRNNSYEQIVTASRIGTNEN